MVFYKYNVRPNKFKTNYKKIIFDKSLLIPSIAINKSS